MSCSSCREIWEGLNWAFHQLANCADCPAWPFLAAGGASRTRLPDVTTIMRHISSLFRQNYHVLSLPSTSTPVSYSKFASLSTCYSARYAHSSFACLKSVSSRSQQVLQLVENCFQHGVGGVQPAQPAARPDPDPRAGVPAVRDALLRRRLRPEDDIDRVAKNWTISNAFFGSPPEGDTPLWHATVNYCLSAGTAPRNADCGLHWSTPIMGLVCGLNLIKLLCIVYVGILCRQPALVSLYQFSLLTANEFRR